MSTVDRMSGAHTTGLCFQQDRAATSGGAGLVSRLATGASL